MSRVIRYGQTVADLKNGQQMVYDNLRLPFCLTFLNMTNERFSPKGKKGKSVRVCYQERVARRVYLRALNKSEHFFFAFALHTTPRQCNEKDVFAGTELAPPLKRGKEDVFANVEPVSPFNLEEETLDMIIRWAHADCYFAELAFQNYLATLNQHVTKSKKLTSSK